VDTVGDNLAELTEAHIRRRVGLIATVFHEVVSGDLHLDVLHVAPSERKPFHLLCTSGMSASPMSVPKEFAAHDRAEVCVLLDPSWPVGSTDFEDEVNYWPVRLLKVIARLPHNSGTWVGSRHTLQNQNPPVPYADDVDYSGVILLPSLTLGPKFYRMELPSGSAVSFLCIYPLLRDEIDFATSKGPDPLFDRFDGAGLKDVVTKRRASVLS